MDQPLFKPWRTAVVAFSGIALVSAIWGGLYRVGCFINPVFGELPGIHGPLIICGFLGTSFALDRVIALKQVWAEFVPVFILFGSFFLFVKPVGPVCPSIIFVGSAGFSVVCLLLHHQSPTIFNRMILMGSFLWLVGIVLLFLRWPVFNVYLWWVGFVLFTMVGERLELAQRIRLVSSPLWLLTGALVVVFAGQVATAVGHVTGSDLTMEIRMNSIYDPRSVIGMRIAGLGIVATALWLLVYDAAWMTLKNRGLARYTSLCLISGYSWLGMSGALSIVFAGLVSGRPYDALIHAFFIGFVWFTIFAHGPILALSMFGMRVRSMAILYVPILLLHLSLALRIVGDITQRAHWIKTGGIINSLALLAFFLFLAFRLWQDRVPSTKLQGEQLA